jgi:hypothetical protein
MESPLFPVRLAIGWINGLPHVFGQNLRFRPNWFPERKPEKNKPLPCLIAWQVFFHAHEPHRMRPGSDVFLASL